MKKLITFLFIMAAPCFVFGVSPIDEEDNVVIHFSSQTIDTTTHILLMDLSDITNYKHKYTGNFVISAIGVSVDRTGSSGVTSSTGSIKIGVVNVVNSSTGSVTYFYELSLLKGGSFTTPLIDYQNYSPSFIKCKVIPGANVNTDGTTPCIASNDVLAGDTAIQSDVSLNTGAGSTAIPNIGDIILSLTEATAGSYSISVNVLYHSKR